MIFELLIMNITLKDTIWIIIFGVNLLFTNRLNMWYFE